MVGMLQIFCHLTRTSSCVSIVWISFLRLLLRKQTETQFTANFNAAVAKGSNSV